MQLRRALPLTLAALVVATGCVTVHPTAPPEPPHLAPAAARTHASQQPPVPALPLGTLPQAPESESAPPAPMPVQAPAPERVRHRPPPDRSE